MKKLKLKPVDQERQKEIVGGHIGDGDGPDWCDSDGTMKLPDFCKVPTKG